MDRCPIFMDGIGILNNVEMEGLPNWAIDSMQPPSKFQQTFLFIKKCVYVFIHTHTHTHIKDLDLGKNFDEDKVGRPTLLPFRTFYKAVGTFCMLSLTLSAVISQCSCFPGSLYSSKITGSFVLWLSLKLIPVLEHSSLLFYLVNSDSTF